MHSPLGLPASPHGTATYGNSPAYKQRPKSLHDKCSLLSTRARSREIITRTSRHTNILRAEERREVTLREH